MSKQASNRCEYCYSEFVRQSVLRKHYERCKQKPLQELNEYYQIQLQKQQEHYETKIQMLSQQLDEQKQLNKTYQDQLFEIAKQPKQINHHTNNSNTTNHQKTLNIINQLAPYDLTTERVQEILNSHALEKVFKDGPNSIADFVVEKILTDPDTQKPKLIATDRSRGVFKYKDTEGNVHVDNKLTKTTDILQKPLFQSNDQVLVEIFKRHNYDIDNITRETFRDNTELLNCINKHKLGAQLARRIEGEYVSVNDTQSDILQD